jgi:hypothetical protein
MPQRKTVLLRALSTALAGCVSLFVASGFAPSLFSDDHNHHRGSEALVNENASRMIEEGKHVLNSWGPGKFDAELFLDGKPFQPNGRSAAALIPPAFGLAGVNLGTWTGFGSTTYWNALYPIWRCTAREPFTTHD